MTDKIWFLMSPVVICLSFLALGEVIHLLKVLYSGLRERAGVGGQRTGGSPKQAH